MRKAQKREILEIINSLHQLHEEIKNMLEQKNVAAVQKMISDAQETAIFLGEYIEKAEGEEHAAVSAIEEYCEALFCVFEDAIKNDFNINKVNKGYKILRRQLIKVENSVKNDIAVRLEIVFLPYKASMWDSLESIYLAAKDDPDCDAYCVPIPYYDLNPDHSFGQMHYEGGEYPEDIEITDWQEYNFEERKPDVIYIHNPYDMWNLVTSVHPRFYSSNLKKYTDTLVYVPYYVTSGTMMEAQGLLPSYQYVDYIVIQSPEFRKYFDESIPDEKFLPFGSPKIDRVIRKCQNPPEPPEEWAEKMKKGDGGRKRVIFYNTGINAMLADTEVFLKKMEYVFRCFMGKEDVCLLWRPHPLLESTFDSLRPEFRPVYDALKRVFLENNLGIYDTTADIEDSIAWSDAYIGDAGTSVVALFGVAGKPIFILDNGILEEPKGEDWREKVNVEFFFYDQNQIAVIQGNQLYLSDSDKYQYRYFCDLPEDARRYHYYILSGGNGKWYACPFNGQHILVIGKTGVEKKIELKKVIADGDEVFSFPRKYDKYILLLPVNYPAIVRYDTVTEEIEYFTENIGGYVKEKNGQKITGGSLVYQGKLYIASPIDNMVYELDITSGESSVIELPIQSRCGGYVIAEYENEIWLLPYDGQVIVRWNPKTNKVREYEGFPEDFICRNSVAGSKCMEKPFCLPAFYGKYVYLSRGLANMALKLDMDTGEFERWIPDFEREENETKNLELNNSFSFVDWKLKNQKSDFIIYSFTGRRLYTMNSKGTIFQEIMVQIDMDDLESNATGFGKCFEILPYACLENHFNTLDRFLSGKIVGNQFSRRKQIEAYKDSVVNYNDKCGKKVQEFVKKIG
ncbi:MAG: hypothetical protein NC489_15205 [Ruminococcus flavefaciens]|nr:hypothetical protein [Roseburia sp.]MCM1231466.1 hypothetical protein [Ruminococcus flavefaciens]